MQTYKKEYLNKENDKKYNEICNMLDERFTRLVYGLDEEIIIYDYEIKDLILDFTQYLGNKIFLTTELYGIGIIAERNDIEHYTKIRIMERIDKVCK